MVNSPLIRSYLLEGVALGGVTLDSHELWKDMKGKMLQDLALYNL